MLVVLRFCLSRPGLCGTYESRCLWAGALGFRVKPSCGVVETGAIFLAVLQVTRGNSGKALEKLLHLSRPHFFTCEMEMLIPLHAKDFSPVFILKVTFVFPRLSWERTLSFPSSSEVL